MRRFISISSLFLTLHLSAQELYIPPNAEVTVTNGATLTTGGGLLNESQRLDIQGEMVNYGPVDNQRFLNNSGIISLYGNWASQGTYNGSAGEMIFLGNNDQVIFNTYLLIDHLTINKIGTVTLTGDSVKITGELNFEDGVLSANEDTRFIVEKDASINHMFGSTSYFEGTIISRGTDNRLFPVGNDGYYGTIELLDLTGIAPEIGVSLTHQNPTPPTPGQNLIGVSSENVWEVELREGSLDSVQLQIDFIAEDLENFKIENSTRRRIESPVIAVSDSGTAGPYRSLGVELLTATDSVTMGLLLSGEYAKFENYGSKYFAIALAPLIHPAGQIYFPNVFSPAASDAKNKTYRVFGEHLANEPFRMEIYNRFSTLVYEANTFEEANTEGWNGINLNGKEETTGMYYVFVRYAFANDPDNIKQYTGSIMLKR